MTAENIHITTYVLLLHENVFYLLNFEYLYINFENKKNSAKLVDNIFLKHFNYILSTNF